MKVLIEMSAGKYSRGKMRIESVNPREIYERIAKLMKECYATKAVVYIESEGKMKEQFTLSR